MKKLLLILLLTLSYNAYSQLYAPEIKVQDTQWGNIGLGVTNPYDALTIGHSNTNRLGFSPAQTNSDYNVIQGYSSGLKLFAGAHNIHYEAGNQPTHYHKFKVGGIDNLLYISGNGRVGINMGSPQATLHVNGDAFVKDLRIVENVDKNIETSWIYSKFGSNRQLGLMLTNDGNTKAEIKLWEGNSHEPYISFSTSPNTGDMVERMRINRHGNVGIGYTNPGYKLQVYGQVASYGTVLTSDQRVKQDIQDYPVGIDLVKKINVKKYKYKPPKKKASDAAQEEEDDFYDQIQIGVLAQEIQQIAPDLVSSFVNEDGEEILTLNHTALTYILINAVKELSTTVEQQQQEIQTLKSNRKK